MPLRANMEPHDFLEIFSRRKRLILVSFVLVMFGASVYCILAPERYMSTVKILVIPPQVSETLVRSAMDYSVQERIGALREQVLSRTRLVQVIDELGLFMEDRATYPPEALALELQGRIQISVPRKGGNTFTLSFVHENPNTAMLTATKLASFFVEEDIRVRELVSSETSGFLDSQLEETKKRLEEQEERIKGYKTEYLGELPEQMNVNLSLLSRLQEKEKSNAEAIMRAEDRKVLLESEITKLQTQGLGGTDPVDALVDALEQKQRQLRDLSTKFTESYPTVAQLRSEIAELEARILAMENGEDVDAAGPAGAVSPGKVPTRRPRAERSELRRLRGQVGALDREIAALRREREETRHRILSVDEKVGRLPQREQEMISLTRDYDNLKRSYDDLLKRKLQAGVSQNLEEGQKGERFQILDPPTLPSKPFEPNRQKALGLAFLGALALGFGGALGLEILDPTLRTAKEFKHFFDLPILATFPVIQDKESTRKKSLWNKALLAGIVSFACAVAAFLLVYQERIRAVLTNSGGIG